MATIKNPLLSLESRGTLADTLTFQRTRGRDTARKKPTPTGIKTLPQVYHRWDYQDYLEWWGTLSLIQKRAYAAQGSRSHNTMLGAFLKEKLSTLPDLAGRWRLDEAAGATAYDSSKNGNNGVIHGASPTTGLIAGAFSFDGVDDYIDCGNSDTLNPTQAITIEFFARNLIALGLKMIISKGPRLGSYAGPYTINAEPGYYTLRLNSAAKSATIAVPGTAWHHLAWTYDKVNIIRYLDGSQYLAPVPYSDPLQANTDPLFIGVGYEMTATIRYFKGDIDELRIENRALSATEIAQHAERRYP